MINIENITVYMQSRTLLENASVQISDNQKIGIVGLNGCGKSTLFKIIKGELEPTDGKITISNNQIISYVEQEFYDTNIPVMDFVLSKDKRLMQTRAKLQTATPEELPEIYEELRILDSDSREAQIANILSGLGFDDEDLTRPISDFSGGWRMRLALAGALFKYSDILLLDEPTNHLDLEASIWLMSYLKKYKGTLIIISHDKNILNDICENIIHFENQKLVFYSGNYDTFYKNYILKHENEEKLAKKQAETKAHLQSFVDRFRYKATKARQAQSRLKMLEKLEDIVVTELDKSSHFNFKDAPELPSPIIKIENGSTGYNETPILNKLNLIIGANDRIGILGKNGNGKSTLAKLIYGDLKLLKGTMFKNTKLNIAYFTQHQAEDLPLNKTPLEYISSLLPDKTETQVRSLLGNFGIIGDIALTSIKELSGGEKSRVVFTKLSLNNPSLIILDEPTNHLDIQARDALITALNNYNGAVILITHDFNFLNMVVDDLYLVDNHTCTPFDGTLDDYKNFIVSKPKREKPEQKKQTHAVNPKETRQLKANLLKLESKLRELNEERDYLIAQLSQPKDGETIAPLSKQLHTLETKIATTENEWLQLADSIN
ncbi:ABC-F family ATP-binding cassette domain-containing protein [bacterium]|nr:ABC-F family ATP-binding cassette domain-containing protein [bacterium]